MRNFGGRCLGFVRGLLGVLLVACLLPTLAGCGSGKPNGPRVARAPGSKIDPQDLAGRWRLQYVQAPVELDFVLVDIKHKDKKFTAELVGVDKLPAPLTLKNADINDEGQVRLEVGLGDIGWSFQGRLDGENIWGTIMAPQFQISPAKMQRTEMKFIDQAKEPEKIASVGAFMSAQNSSDPYVAMSEFVKKSDTYRSPLLIEAYSVLARYVKEEKLTLEKVKSLTAEYHKAIDIWGPRMAPRVELEVSKSLATQELYPEYARELLEQAEKLITQDYPLEWKAQVADTWVRLGDPQHALKLLKPLRELDAVNPALNMIYAQAQERAKNVDEALKVYADLAVLPQFEGLMTQSGAPGIVLPSEAVARLWKAKHGDTKGLDAYLKSSYAEQMQRFIPKRTPAERAAKGKVSFLELFTGASCSPCVPADIAAEALRSAFSDQELVVIKYHTHVPMVDPLANESCMKRFLAYSGKGTPLMVFNGKAVNNAGGYVSQATQLIKNLQAAVDEESKQTSPVEVKVAATRNGDEVKIKATVNGITTSDNDPRLILVLLEDGILFEAPNGIRVHNCVARGFSDGPVGIKVPPGKELVHEPTMSINKLKTELDAHLQEVEKSIGQQFPVKPMELRKLQVAAIVQNEITKSFIQAAVTDVVVEAP